MRREVYLRLGDRSSYSKIVHVLHHWLDCTYHDINAHFFKQKTLQRLGSERNLIALLYLSLDHQVIYRYSPKKVRTLFENKLDSFHWLYRRKIK